MDQFKDKNLMCQKCKKIFSNSSNLKKHENKKYPCIKPKIELECNLCNIKFRYNIEKERHEKTSKHIKNITNNIINNVDNSINSNIINNFNQQFNINFPLNTFQNSNLDLMQNHDINEHLDKISNHYIRRANLDEENHLCTMKFIQSLILIIQELNFNFKDIRKFQNNNIKILYFLNKYVRNTDIIQYLIFDINSNNELIWKEITYEDFIHELFKLMNLINNRYEILNLNYILEYLDKYFKNNEYIQNLTKKDIEGKLYTLSNIFTYKRDDLDLTKNINNHIKKETKLLNGIEANVKFIADFLTQDT